MIEEALYDDTEMAMKAVDNRFHADASLLVRFFMLPRQNEVKSKEEGRAVFEDLEYVEIRQPGNKLSAVVREARDMDKSRFPEHYRRFLARESQTSASGTPLAEWPMITRSRVEELKFINVHTVEQLAEVADVHAGQFMGMQNLKRQAQEWLSSHTSDMAEAMAAIAELKAQIAALQGAEPELEEVEEEEE
jgi:hypothetical protein